MKLKFIYFLFCSCLFFVKGLFAQEAPPSPTDNSNWVSSINYDISGQTLSKSVGFFNDFGRPEQSQSWDVLSGKVWGNETLYDYHGRAALSTLSAPLNSTGLFTYDSSFLQESSGNYETSDFDQGSFIENPKVVSASSKLGSYFNNNSTNQYQDNTNYPFSRVIYSKLNPGATKKVLGGNKINNEWLQTYSFSMPAGQELSKNRAFNNVKYNNILVTKTISRDVHGVEVVVFTDTDGNTLASARSGNEAGDNNYTTQNTILIKDQGWVDFHISQGCSQNITLLNRNIATGITGTTTGGGSTGNGDGGDCFQDENGMLRIIEDTQDCIGLRIQDYESKRGNARKNKKQKKVEFAQQFQKREISYDNLPVGIYYRVYDLITEEIVMQVVPGNYTLPEGFYRIELRYGTIYNFPLPWGGTFHISYNVSDNPFLFELDDKEYGVRHCQNYYDYALNYYDKTGRLLKATQPESINLKSEFSYNSLGQLLETTSRDEGEAKFIYRKDGQIRFSQNGKQLENHEFSYTNYDRLGRPIESGVYASDDIDFYLAPETPHFEPVQIPIFYPVTAASVHNVLTVNPGGGNLSPGYRKSNGLEVWNSGFTSAEIIEENGRLSFKTGPPNSTVLQFGNYSVVVGLSTPDVAADPNYQSIKYGINLTNVSGVNLVQIHENGDFLRDTNNQIINFGSFSGTDMFSIERNDGAITYLKNNIIFHTSPDTNVAHLVADVSFGYSKNAIHNVIVNESPATPPPPTEIDIQTLVNVQDGLSDKKCKEQHFTLYDMPDNTLNDYLTKCSLPSNLYKQTFLSGNVSKTYTKSPETTTTWHSYDVYGRVKWIIQNINGLDCLKTIDYTYDVITGQVVKVDYQRHEQTERFVHKYEYNIGGQLTRVSTSINDLSYREQAKYFYNETGQLIRTELAENLQGIDYVYNLNGQLKAINHPSLQAANDPGHDGTNGFVSDVFGMTLQYHTGDYTRTNTPTPIAPITVNTPDQFNGNIQAIQWQNENGQPSTYAYSYNKNNWLQGAQYSNANSANAEDYKLSDITYDANGNIKTLKRNGHSNGAGTNAMDNFTYKYKALSNQLDHIDDTNDNPNATRFNDLKDQGKDNYIYNSIGQLVINKQDKTLYEYNASGLVTNISELSNYETSSYHTLYLEDFEGAVNRYNNWWTINGLKHHVIANQEDQEDLYSGFLPISPGGESIDPESVKLPDYCVDFDTNDTYKNRLQFNYYNSAHNTNSYTVKSEFKTIKDAYHKLDFDLFLFQKQLISSVLLGQGDSIIDINTIATITLRQEDDSVIQTIVVDSQDYTQSYCNRVLDHINFNFLATGSKVHLSIEVTNNGEVSNGTTMLEHAYKSIYQSLEVDNVHLKVANDAKVAFYYNDRSQRVRKESYIGSELIKTIYVRDVSGNPVAIYYRPGRALLRLKENPVYGLGRIGVFNRVYGGRTGGSYVYQIADHLGNVRAVIAKNGTNAVSLVGKTDYYPFGMPMPDRSVEGDYRYGYQGEYAEKDPETGLNAFQLRLWDSRIGRWLTTDPMNEFYSLYLGMGNNPISLTDPTGGSTGGCPDPPCNDLPFGATPLIGEGGFIADDNGYFGGNLDEVLISSPKKISFENDSAEQLLNGLAEWASHINSGNKTHLRDIIELRTEAWTKGDFVDGFVQNTINPLYKMGDKNIEMGNGDIIGIKYFEGYLRKSTNISDHLIDYVYLNDKVGDYYQISFLTSIEGSNKQPVVMYARSVKNKIKSLNELKMKTRKLTKQKRDKN